MMSSKTRRTLGTVLLTFPAVVIVGGIAISNVIMPGDGDANEAFVQEMYRAGYAHTATVLVLALVVLGYVDDALLNNKAKSVVRWSVPTAAALLMLGFFLAATSRGGLAPEVVLTLLGLGAILLIVGVVILGIGLVRK